MCLLVKQIPRIWSQSLTLTPNPEGGEAFCALPLGGVSLHTYPLEPTVTRVGPGRGLGVVDGVHHRDTGTREERIGAIVEHSRGEAAADGGGVLVKIAGHGIGVPTAH